MWERAYIVETQLMRPCVCVYMFFKHLLVQHLCSHVVLFFVLSWCKHFTHPNHTPTHIWLFTTHSRCLFHFFRLIFMLHGCSQWRRHSLHHFYRFSAISASCCSLFLLQKWIQHTYRNIMRYNDDYYVFRLW